MPSPVSDTWAHMEQDIHSCSHLEALSLVGRSIIRVRNLVDCWDGGQEGYSWG